MDSAAWDSFASHLRFISVDLDKKKAYTDLAKRLSAEDNAWKTRANRKRARIVVEKPFCPNLASAQKLRKKRRKIK